MAQRIASPTELDGVRQRPQEVRLTSIEPVSKGVELSATTDPDGNAITLIGNLRVKY